MSYRIQVRVVPNASRDEIVGRMGDAIKVKLQAVPEDGRANKALLELLGKRMGCRPRQLTIVSGTKSRLKTIEIPRGVDPGDLLP